MKTIYRIRIKILVLISLLATLTSCYTSKTTSYITKENYAVFEIKSEHTEDNFTHEKNGLKLTYDFWGKNLIVVLENISDKTIFVDIDKSQVSTGKEKASYNSMIVGDFNILPLEPGNKIELDDFYIINNDNENFVKEKIKSAKSFIDANLTFKNSDYPIKLENKIYFGFSQENISEFVILDKFYAERVKIITPSEFNHLNQYGKLYNRTYYQTTTRLTKETTKLEPIIPPADMAEIFINTLVTVLFIALEFY